VTREHGAGPEVTREDEASAAGREPIGLLEPKPYWSCLLE
jgi:hypothetical protein